jgi:hypothetical protein
MHELMVKSLPEKCRLTAIFDVSRTNNMIWDTSSLTTFCRLAILGHFSVRRSFAACGFLITAHHIPDLPYVVRKLFPDRLKSP